MNGSVTSPSASKGRPEYFPIFDWLRFILASVVAMGHEGIITWGASGPLAVQIFFALSGWLIGGILLHTTPNGVARFYFNRATRIWIPYFLAVAAIYIFSAIRDPINGLYFEFLLYDVTFTHNYFVPVVPDLLQLMPLLGAGTHLWSIAVEEQFYLAAPLIILFLPRGRGLLTWCVIAAAMYSLQTWYASVSLGVLAAVAQERFGSWHNSKRGRGILLVAALMLLVGLLAHPDRFRLLAPPLSIAIVLLAAIVGPRSAIGGFLGGVSYPLYLNHWMGQFAANLINNKLHLLEVWILPWASYAIAVMLSCIAYILVDRNIQRYRAGYFTHRRGMVIGFIAYISMTVGLISGILWDLPARFGRDITITAY